MYAFAQVSPAARAFGHGILGDIYFIYIVCVCVCVCVSVYYTFGHGILGDVYFILYTHTHTHTHTLYMYVYINVYIIYYIICMYYIICTDQSLFHVDDGAQHHFHPQGPRSAGVGVRAHGHGHVDVWHHLDHPAPRLLVRHARNRHQQRQTRVPPAACRCLYTRSLLPLY